MIGWLYIIIIEAEEVLTLMILQYISYFQEVSYILELACLNVEAALKIITHVIMAHAKEILLC